MCDSKPSASRRDEESLSVADWAELGRVLDEHRVQLLAMLERRIDPKLAVRIDAEEVFHEACLVARRRWARFKQDPGEITPYTWLYGIVLSKLKDCWRREAAQRRDMHRNMPWPDQSSIQLAFGLMSKGTTPSKKIERKELHQQMHQALAMLKEKDREILWMRHFDRLSFKDASHLVGISENNAAVRYVRAVERLKKLWRELFPDEASQL